MVVVVVVVSSRNRLNRLPAQPFPAQPNPAQPIPAFNPSCFNFCLIGLLRILPYATFASCVFYLLRNPPDSSFSRLSSST